MRRRQYPVVETLALEPEDMEPEEPARVPLDEKRFLCLVEFQQYTSLGKNRAAELARVAGVTVKFGRRVLIDRVKFDRWCDQQG